MRKQFLAKLPSILFPIGILFGGEELHANHHIQPWNPKFSHKWFEFDIGWCYIKFLMFLKLLNLRNNNPKN
jgi:stearoyl-CoA desaturase (delta-9 desaturase)